MPNTRNAATSTQSITHRKRPKRRSNNYKWIARTSSSDESAERTQAQKPRSRGKSRLNPFPSKNPLSHRRIMLARSSQANELVHRAAKALSSKFRHPNDVPTSSAHDQKGTTSSYRTIWKKITKTSVHAVHADLNTLKAFVGVLEEEKGRKQIMEDQELEGAFLLSGLLSKSLTDGREVPKLNQHRTGSVRNVLLLREPEPTTCLRCGPHALATRWPILQMLARHHHTPTAHATPEQPPLLHTHFKPAPAGMLATVKWQPNVPAEWRVQRGAFRTKHPALTYPVLAKHRSATPEAPAYPTKHRCSREVPETQTIDWTTYHPKLAYLLQYIHKYLIQGHERNRECVQIDAAATEKNFHQGIGVYAIPRIKSAVRTPWATTARESHVHTSQPPSLCRTPRPDDQNTIIFADASGTTGLTPAAGGLLRHYRQMKRASCGNTT